MLKQYSVNYRFAQWYLYRLDDYNRRYQQCDEQAIKALATFDHDCCQENGDINQEKARQRVDVVCAKGMLLENLHLHWIGQPEKALKSLLIGSLIVTLLASHHFSRRASIMGR
jgi:hypothetical protein